MPRQILAVLQVLIAGQVFRQIGKFVIQEPQQRAEGLFVAAVRRGGHQNHVPAAVLRQALHHLVPLVPGAAASSKGAGVGLVHNHKFRAGAFELFPAPVRFNIIH